MEEVLSGSLELLVAKAVNLPARAVHGFRGNKGKEKESSWQRKGMS